VALNLLETVLGRTGGALDTCVVVSWVPWGDGPRGVRCCRALSTRAILSGASQALRRRQQQPRLGLCSRCALTYARRRAGGYSWREVGECCPVRLAKAGRLAGIEIASRLACSVPVEPIVRPAVLSRRSVVATGDRSGSRTSLVSLRIEMSPRNWAHPHRLVRTGRTLVRGLGLVTRSRPHDRANASKGPMS
jgi:hypothetical protein